MRSSALPRLRCATRPRRLHIVLLALLVGCAPFASRAVAAPSGTTFHRATPTSQTLLLPQLNERQAARPAEFAERPLYRVATAPTGTTIEQRPQPALVEEAFGWARAHGVALQRGELEPALFADAADGRLDQFALIDAALVASGVQSQSELDRYRQLYQTHLTQLRLRMPHAANERQQARLVFEFMHANILRTYGLTATELTGVLDRGLFNCVSSAVLFSALAGEFQLETGGVEIPGHAFSYLVLPEGPLDVETTCPDWFNVLEDPQRQAELLRRSLGVNYDPAQRHIARREVPTLGLIAVIYYNRGVDRLEQRQFTESVADNLKALRIDSNSAPAWGNFLASLNNWALSLAEQGAFPQALEMLADGRRFAPTHAIFRTNTVAIYQQWVDHLLQAGQPQEALARIQDAQQRHPDEPHFARLATELKRRSAWQLVHQGHTAEAVRLVTADAYADDAATALLGLLEVAALEQNHTAASRLLAEAEHLPLNSQDHNRLRDVCFDAYRQHALRLLEAQPNNCGTAIRDLVTTLENDRTLAADAAMQAGSRGWLVEAWRNEAEHQRQRGDWQRAAAIWDRALADPLLAGHRHWQTETQRLAERHYTAWAQMLIQRHDLIQAQEVCQRGLAACPRSGQLERLQQTTTSQLAAGGATPQDHPAGDPVSRGWRGSRLPSY